MAKIGNFWYKFSPKGYILVSDFFYKIWHGRDSQARTFVPNLTIVTFKMWAYSPKITEKIGNCLSNAMHGQNINLPVSVCLCVCVCHTFYQLNFRLDRLTP